MLSLIFDVVVETIGAIETVKVIIDSISES